MNAAVMYRVLGMVFWGVLLGASGSAIARFLVRDRAAAEHDSPGSLVRFLIGPTAQPLAIDPVGTLRVGDPVFFESPNHGWRQIGFVSRTSVVASAKATPHVTGGSPAVAIELDWYASEPDPKRCQLTQHHNDGRMADVVRMLFPAEKRERIQQHLVEAFQLHGDQISAAVVPLVEQSLRESLPLIEAELKASVSRHRSEVEAVAGRLNRDLVQGRLIPLAKEQLMPIVRRHAEAPAEAIGRELWDRASLWRFGWRAVYDSTPLPNKGLVREEWKRFVDEEATEVIESHLDELTVAVQRIVADVASDPTIRKELAEAAESVADDPPSRALVQTILKEAVVENQSLRNRWREIWTSEQATAALSIAGSRLEPVVRKIGDEIFGSRSEGIDPDFARVLRHQILGKDRRWIVAAALPGDIHSDGVAQPGVDEPPVIRIADEPMVFPIVYLADSPAGASR